ncbi:unnamed protein product [Rotaria sordida]|uniref:Uncharacterized protein n=1 Tax=Rotaria sordida TaxID=392033 RepID=A0A814HG48_9BILA|nr:unnamed protein product [Rotaria sordida]CAF0840850.1 unnamed protein product [Rotaria sordida]CAF1009319.1 unnamed protein product [Rotaria sordida]CAF3839008.1 unnamed protein product [Rotaria sordida]
MTSQQAEKGARSTDPTRISSVGADRSTGTSGQLGSASTAEPEGSSALGDSNFAGMSSISPASNQRQKSDDSTATGQGMGGAGEGQGGASQPWSTSSGAP